MNREVSIDVLTEIRFLAYSQIKFEFFLSETGFLHQYRRDRLSDASLPPPGPSGLTLSNSLIYIESVTIVSH